MKITKSGSRWDIEGHENDYQSILELIDSDTPFAFTRWGDGELNAAYGRRGANCDKHQYFPDMGARLKAILYDIPSPGHIFGIQPLGYQQRPQLIDAITNKDWYNADVFHSASIDDEFHKFIELMQDRTVILIGNEDLKPYMKELNTGNYVDVPKIDAWLSYGRVKNAVVRQMNSHSNAIFLFCSGMMTNIMIDELWKEMRYETGGSPQHTMIDMGSVFEPYVGKKTRSYHVGILERENK